MDKQKESIEMIVCPAIEVTSINEEGSIAQYDFIGVSYEAIRENDLYESHVIREDVQEEKLGFITNKNRFVDPIEAQKIAIECGQYRNPHVRIKSLEESIEVGWDSVKYAKTSVMITSLKKQIAEDQATLEALKTGYLGNALRVEDLHYVKP